MITTSNNSLSFTHIEMLLLHKIVSSSSIAYSTARKWTFGSAARKKKGS